MLRTALGPMIAAHLEDPGIVEIMLNPDGRLWIDRLKGGLEDTGERLSAADGERIVRLVAHHVGAEVHVLRERLSRLHETLDPRIFARIHRSTIVNLLRIKEIQPWFSGDYVVILKNGTQLRMSRHFRESMERQLKS